MFLFYFVDWSSFHGFRLFCFWIWLCHIFQTWFFIIILENNICVTKKDKHGNVRMCVIFIWSSLMYREKRKKKKYAKEEEFFIDVNNEALSWIPFMMWLMLLSFFVFFLHIKKDLKVNNWYDPKTRTYETLHFSRELYYFLIDECLAAQPH